MSRFQVGDEVYWYADRYGQKSISQKLTVTKVTKTSVTTDNGGRWTLSGDEWGTGNDPYGDYLQLYKISDGEYERRLKGFRRYKNEVEIKFIYNHLSVRNLSDELIDDLLEVLRRCKKSLEVTE